MKELHLPLVPAADPEAAAACRKHWDQLTKPRGSLSVLEDLAARLAAMAGMAVPQPGPAAVLVFAGDHGVATEGVSAYPQEVTVQMLHNLRLGGAAINVISRRSGAALWVTDVASLAGRPGEQADLPPLQPGGAPVRVRRVRAGTGNIAHGPAMSRDEALLGLRVGEETARAALDALAAPPESLPTVAVGELGIANTTAAAALAAALTGLPAADLVGAGTGLDEAGLRTKAAAVTRALGQNQPQREDPLGCVAAVGGLEFAAMAGAVLGAAARRAAVVVDGFSAAVAALLAVRLCPAAGAYLVAGTGSPEPGQAPVLGELQLRPLLDLGLRLGEASGAALGLGLVQQTLAIGAGMATFDSAGVADRHAP